MGGSQVSRNIDSKNNMAGIVEYSLRRSKLAEFCFGDKSSQKFMQTAVGDILWQKEGGMRRRLESEWYILKNYLQRNDI